jgi:hypothetical protein
MAAENCSPAVASRRAEYVDEFQVPTLLGEQPRSQKKNFPPTHNFYFNGSSGLF